MGAKILTSILLLLLIPSVLATSHYSYEHAEELKPLINWHDYGPDAFNEAVQQNKPVFLLLTAPSWCYWCQVYESEEYLFDPDVVEYINTNLIPVYVDADQRQDLTRQYLEGGWPSTTILAPNRERLYGYSGPRPPLNMLANMEQARQYVQKSGFANQVSYNYQKTEPVMPTKSQLRSIINGFSSFTLQIYDPIHGGFGTGQKFPQGRTLDHALEVYERTGDQRFLELVQNTLENQYTDSNELATNYNLFDPVEGGFHRYGTKRDWTPPHYEKMLYDNAKLLRAYAHLQKLINDPLVDEVVEKTRNYMETQWYDPQGGFYGNTDVHGEDEYYGKHPRPADKPRVEQTKYADWNAEAIITYLSLDEDIAEQSLDFFAKEMVTEKGAYHYLKPDGTKGVTGSLLDNAYLLLAFVEGYDVLEKDSHLETAEQLADYSVDNLFDWYGGGFFERNSKDTDLYAPGEQLRLNKPSEENGVIAYALLKLYTQTNNPVYLYAAVTTIGNKFDSAGGLDRGYYYVKAAELINEQNLLAEVKQIDPPQNYWLDDIIAATPTGFAVSDQGLEKLEGSFILLALIALIAGMISFASPCTLPILPAYIAYTFNSSKQNIKGMTITFFLGLSVVFTLLGMTATVIGSFLKSYLSFFSQIAGLFIIFFGVYILLGKGFAGITIKQKPTSYAGSFAFGSALALSWTPCVGPILVAILVLASTTSSTITGGLLLFIYGMGLALPLVVLSSYLGKVNKEGKVWKFIQGKELHVKIGKKTFAIHTSALLSGTLFIILGFLIFSGLLFSFNQYIATSSFQKYIFSVEDWLFGLVK